MGADCSDTPSSADNDWMAFQGGELEGRRPAICCPACRRFRGQPTERARPLCFQCYRADFDRARALRAAGGLETASEGRFQFLLPFERVNRPRLIMLKADRAAARVSSRTGSGRFTERVRHAQIAARHAFQTGASGLQLPATPARSRDRWWRAAAHAVELQLPESWLPFVVVR
jgi:hypothetical protein